MDSTVKLDEDSIAKFDNNVTINDQEPSIT